MKLWMRWLLRAPFVVLITLGLPGLAAGGLGWFWGDWAGTAFILSTGVWLVSVGAVRTSRVGIKDRHVDLGSLFFLVGIFVAIMVPVYDWTHTATRTSSVAWIAVGLGLVVAGTGLDVVAVRTLDRSFAAVAMLLPAQRLVQEGPYRYIRHPIYAAVLLWGIGLALILASLVAVVATLLFLAPAITLRILSEERLLLEQFGDDYRTYCKRTRRLIPFVW